MTANYKSIHKPNTYVYLHVLHLHNIKQQHQSLTTIFSKTLHHLPIFIVVLSFMRFKAIIFAPPTVGWLWMACSF